MKNLNVQVASVDDREGLVAEIWHENEMVAEVNAETGKPQIEIYRCQSSGHWKFDLEEFLESVLEAKRMLA